ncbi:MULTISPECIES: hypothetical protein [Streptomyces]|uniref:Uncharacterized protein n=2 Tax=Streptomyces TaxID=1883 RepID=A0A100Y9T1_9ACTN|nr:MULTISPECIES: hypothetical protein [Streptomyces]KUH40397.1 hypothetical protein ATE80_02045 [Streptomyces kanasensis]UUS29846.1 hypothetical protein NRO40_02685 [Streptomyces changanensis]
MTSAGRTLTVLHLFLVWAAMTAAVPMLGLGVLGAAWGGGAGAAVPVLALGVPAAVGLLAAAGTPARTVVPLCGSVPRRLGWAVLVFVLGTLGVLAGLAAYDEGVDLGSAGTRIALTGVPYAVAAALFVPDRWLRPGAVAALAAAVAYGGFVGPAQSERHRHEADVARFRENPELMHLGTAPPGMQVSRAEAGSAYFGVEYRAVRQDVFAYVSLAMRPALTPALRCPEFPEPGVSCAVDAHGEMRTVRDLPGGTRAVTLTRRHRNAEAEVTSQTLDEAGLRRFLDSLHPLTDRELEELMREKKIGYRF